jgi:flavin-dependent dehydrogenase
VIIGGGPAGATAGTLLADAGFSVLILEGARFPRFAVGEIIAPTALWRVWHRLGFSQEFLDEKFIRKWAGGWQAPDGTLFRFDQDVHPDDSRCRPFVYTVERALYDQLHLDNARHHGAEALEEAWVEEVVVNDDKRVVGVRFQHKGEMSEVSCQLVIDASGRENVLARKLGLRLDLVELKSFSIFAHYEGATRNEGRDEGDVRILFGENMWFWWAPLKQPKVSIGIVAHRDYFWEEYAGNPEAFYEKYVQVSPFIRDRIRNATRITGFRRVERGTGQATLQEYHYRAEKLVGDGWALVGDAGGFVDPIFSAGLYVAQTSAMWLADEVAKILGAGHHVTAERLKGYCERYTRDLLQVMGHIQTYATHYFDPRFVNFYLGLGSRSERIRRLYIDTFVAYDRAAIAQYSRLIDRHFKNFTTRHELPGTRAGACALSE